MSRNVRKLCEKLGRRGEGNRSARFFLPGAAEVSSPVPALVFSKAEARRRKSNGFRLKPKGQVCLAKAKSQKGFTLIEVLMAITCLAVGLVLIVQAMGRTQQALRLSENLSLAAQAAEEQIVRLELHARERGVPGFGSQGEEKYPGREYEWKTRVEGYSGAAVKDGTVLTQVTAEVDWKESGIGKNLRVSTLVMDRGKK